MDKKRKKNTINKLSKKDKKKIQIGIWTILLVSLFALVFVIIPSIVVQKEPCNWDFESSLGCTAALLTTSTIGLVLLVFVGISLVVFGIVSVIQGILNWEKAKK